MRLTAFEPPPPTADDLDHGEVRTASVAHRHAPLTLKLNKSVDASKNTEGPLHEGRGQTTAYPVRSDRVKNEF